MPTFLSLRRAIKETRKHRWVGLFSSKAFSITSFDLAASVGGGAKPTCFMPPALFVGTVLEERFLSQHIFWKQSVHICLYTQPPFWAQTSSLWVSPAELSGISVSCKIYVIVFSPENCAFSFSHLGLIGKTLSALEKHISGQFFMDTPIRGADGCRFKWDKQRQHLRSRKHEIVKEPLGVRASCSRVPFIQLLWERKWQDACQLRALSSGTWERHTDNWAFWHLPAPYLPCLLSTALRAGIWMCDTQTFSRSKKVVGNCRCCHLLASSSPQGWWQSPLATTPRGISICNNSSS